MKNLPHALFIKFLQHYFPQAKYKVKLVISDSVNFANFFKNLRKADYFLHIFPSFPQAIEPYNVSSFSVFIHDQLFTAHLYIFITVNQNNEFLKERSLVHFDINLYIHRPEKFKSKIISHHIALLHCTRTAEKNYTVL